MKKVQLNPNLSFKVPAAIVTKPSSQTKKRRKSQPKQASIQNHVTKFSYATKGGISAKNPNKKNQDAFIIEPLFDGHRDVHLFGVCDGHGVNGREVSALIKVTLPLAMKKNLGPILSRGSTSPPTESEV